MDDRCATSRYPRRSLYGHVRRPRRPGPNMVFVVPVAGSATGPAGNCRTRPLTAGATNPVAPGTASVIPPRKTQATAPDETLVLCRRGRVSGLHRVSYM